MRGRTGVAWCVAGGLAVAGCGGDDAPTPAEAKAAEQRWAQRADDACAKLNDAVADRGWPVDLVDLDRLVARGVADAQQAIATITRLRLPEGAGREPRAFVAELRRVAPALDTLSDASEELEPDALLSAADALKPQFSRLEDRARAAGLTDCVAHDERFLVPDAVRGPVFAEQLARLDRALFRRIERLQATPPRTPQAAAELYGKLGEVIEANVAGLDRLEPPQWAARQTSDYQDVLLDFDELLSRAQSLFDQGREALTLPKLRRLTRDFRSASREERVARRKMLRAVGAAPTTRPPDDAPADPDEELIPS